MAMNMRQRRVLREAVEPYLTFIIMAIAAIVLLEITQR
jgi:hypothetical protein